MRDRLTRESVVEATREMIIRSGLEALSLRKVAAELGVTAPALYAHFKGKLDLLQAVAEVEFQRLIRAFSEARREDPIDTIRAQSFAYVNYARENPQLFQAMFLFRPELTAEPRGDELPLATTAFNAGLEPVVAAIEAGILKDRDPLLIGLTIWTAAHGVATVILHGPDLGRAAEDALTSSVIDSVIEGLSA